MLDTPHLNPPSSAFLDGLREITGPHGWATPENAPAYLEEPRGLWRGHAGLILRPETTTEVAEIVRRCAEARVAIVPYAGGTGLVGGQVLTDGSEPVLLSVDRMRKVRDVSPDDGAMVVEAGVTLADAQAAADDADRLFPLSLASEGSCRIGGNLATNAGGVQVLRYGNMRDLCLGVEAVLPDGSIHDGLSRLRKNNMGWDLRHLLIGSEGALGVITAASLKLFPKPRRVQTALVGLASPRDAIALLHHLRDRLGETISAFELISRASFELLQEHFPDIRDPLTEPTPWYVLTEAAGGEGADVEALVEAALGEALEKGLIADAALAASEGQRGDFWRIRETIPEANRLTGSISSHDLSTPISRIPEFIDRASSIIEQIDPTLRINCFGHLGDGNLHYNVFPPKGRRRGEFDNIRVRVRESIHEVAMSLDGSISAEHGVGRMKTGELVRYGDPAMLTVMRQVKAALDPHGIMNPGAVLARS